MKKLIVSKGRFLTVITFLFAILMISNSCNKSSYNSMMGITGGPGGTGGSGAPGANEVFIQGMVFNPSTITVTAGTTITWTNKDVASHTVTSDPGSGSLNGPTIGQNDTYSFMFSTADTVTYHCAIHLSMKGTVIVK